MVPVWYPAGLILMVIMTMLWLYLCWRLNLGLMLLAVQQFLAQYSSSLLPVPGMVQNNDHSAVNGLSEVILIYPDGMCLVTTDPSTNMALLAIKFSHLIRYIYVTSISNGLVLPNGRQFNTLDFWVNKGIKILQQTIFTYIYTTPPIKLIYQFAYKYYQVMPKSCTIHAVRCHCYFLLESDF